MPVTGETRLSALMPDDQDVQVLILCAVNHRIGKRLEREDSAVFRGRSPKSRMRKQELNDVLKFIQKTCCYLQSRVLLVKVLRDSDVLFRTCMKRVIHRASRARNRAMTSSPGRA